MLYSLFEEQIFVEQYGLQNDLNRGVDSFPEALSYFPEPETLDLASEKYYQLIQKAKRSTEIPIIASLNGTTLGGWTDCAKNMEQAGADGLELNLYNIPDRFQHTRGGFRGAQLRDIPHGQERRAYSRGRQAVGLSHEHGLHSPEIFRGGR